MNEAQAPSSQVLKMLTPTRTQQEPSQQDPCPLVVLASPQKMPSGVHCMGGMGTHCINEAFVKKVIDICAWGSCGSYQVSLERVVVVTAGGLVEAA